ncbi:MAG: hypothetical protein JO019_02865 [Candidatus Kaiserbacteria bacterium]|nr:hypothetical protein [Candidatus Kaiserbacteria bacterium]
MRTWLSSGLTAWNELNGKELSGNPYSPNITKPRTAPAPYVPRTEKRMPLYQLGLFFAFAGMLMTTAVALMSQIAGLPAVPNWWIAAIVFPLAIALNILNQDGSRAKDRAVEAFIMLKAANETVCGPIHVRILEAVDQKNEGELKKFYAAIDWHAEFLRRLYCDAVGREIIIKRAVLPAREVNTYYFSALKAIGLESFVIAGQGRVNGLVQATCALESVRRVWIGRSSLISAFIQAGIALATIGLGLVGDVPTMFMGIVLSGFFTYTTALILLNVLDKASPFGTGVSSLRRGELFAELERWACDLPRS